MNRLKAISKILLVAVLLSSQSNVLSILAETNTFVPSIATECASPSNASAVSSEEGREGELMSYRETSSNVLEDGSAASSSNALEKGDFFLYAIPGEIPSWYTQIESSSEEIILYNYTDRFGAVQWRIYGSWGEEDCSWYPCSAYGTAAKSAAPVDIRNEDMQSAPYRYRSLTPTEKDFKQLIYERCSEESGDQIKGPDLIPNYDGSYYEVWQLENDQDTCNPPISYWFYGIQENGFTDPKWYEWKEPGTIMEDGYFQVLAKEKTADHIWTEWRWNSAPCSTTSHTFGQEFMAFKRRECQVCGAVESGESIWNPIEHEFLEWTLGSKSTCAKEGYEERYCKYYGNSSADCQGYEMRMLPKKEHTWSESSKTASVNGYNLTYCDICGEVVKSIPITYKVRYYINPESTEYIEEKYTYGQYYYPISKESLNWYEENKKGWKLMWQCSNGKKYDPDDTFKNLSKVQDDIVYMTPVMRGNKVSIHLNPIYSLNPYTTCYGYYYQPMELPERKRLGYTFLYWTDSWPEIGKQYHNGDQIDFYTDRNFYEVWEPNQYTVSFADNIISQVLNNGAPEHQKQSVSFDYFYKDDNFGNQIKIWLEPQYKEITNQLDGYGNLPGLTFIGVYTEPDGKGSKVTSGSKMWAENRTLYPYYKAVSYSLVFDENYVGGGSSTTTKHYYDSIDQIPVPTREGYTFKGWYTEKDGKGTQITEESKMPAKTTWCYAYWEENQYSVIYSLKDETPISQSHYKYSEVVYTESEDKAQEVYQAVEPDAYKYYLTNWSTHADGTGQAFAPDTQISKIASEDNATVKLYANWKGKPMELHLNPNGDVNLGSIINGYYNEPIGELPEPRRPGYTFHGWNTTTENDGDVYTKDSLMPYEEMGWLDLYASWIPNEYKVTLVGQASDYAVNGAPEYQDYTEEVIIQYQDNNAGTALSYKESGELSECFDRFQSFPGLIFEGFYTEPNGLGRKIDKNSPMLPQDLILYADYTPQDYTAVFDSCFDPKKNIIRTYHYYDIIGELPKIQRSGYTLQGWYTEEKGGGHLTDPDTRFENHDTFYYAKWIPNTYKITYDYGIGSGTVTEKELLYDTQFGVLPQPDFVPEDFIFCGWHTVKQSTDSIYDGGLIREEYKVTENTNYQTADNCTLYAYYRFIQKKPIQPDDTPDSNPSNNIGGNPDGSHTSEKKDSAENSDSMDDYITFWVLNNKHWYYYDPKGIMATKQWVPYRNRLYWLQANGIMLSNTWFNQDGTPYLLTDNGAMAQSEWAKKDGIWYYFDDKGHISNEKDEISSNFISKGGELIYAGSEERLVNNWYEEYYINEDNVVVTNCWIQEGDDWYYVGTNGKRLRGQWNEVNGFWYYMNLDGRMEKHAVLWEGNWYYMDRSGICYNTNFAK